MKGAQGKSATVIRVLLAEDQTMLRGALEALLNLEPDLSVIAQAANGREAMKLALEHRPDVVVTDIEMPERSGLELAADLKNADSKARVIILTTFARPGYLRRAMDAGARGYLLKERPASELAEAIRRVNAGLRAIDPALAAEAWSSDEDPLSDRERQILQRAGEGRSSAEIATELRLSEGTVRNYLSEAITKLGAANRVDAANGKGRAPIVDGKPLRSPTHRAKNARWMGHMVSFNRGRFRRLRRTWWFAGVDRLR
jgi:two-component system response regulator DesR